MALTPQQKLILEELGKQTGYRSYKVTAKEMNIKPASFRAQLTILRDEGFAEVEEENSDKWTISQQGMDFLKTPQAIISREEVGLNDRQIFEQQGHAIGGIIPEKMRVITNIVWSRDPYDLEWVWHALGEGGVPMDVKKTWFASWRAHLRQAGKPDGIPESIKEEMSPADKRTPQQIAKAKEEGRDYKVEGGDIIRIGGGLGDFTITDAKEILALQTLGRRSTQATLQPSGSQDSIASLITALLPFMKPDTDGGMLKELLDQKLQNMRQEIVSSMPQIAPQKTLLDQATGIVAILKLLTEAGPTIRGVFGLPTQTGQPQQASSPLIQLQNPDGTPVVMDMTNLLTLKKFEAEQKREDESHKAKVEMGGAVKDFVEKIGGAVARSVGQQ